MSDTKARDGKRRGSGPRTGDGPRAGAGGGRGGAGARAGMRRASAFLARRSLRTHRRSWAAVFAAAAAASALLGAFALVLGSLLLTGPPVERYAGADAVVVADQRVTYTAKPWGSEPQTATAHLPERVRLDRSVVARAAAADGVARAVADDSVPVVAGRGISAVGRSWDAAALTPYELTGGRAPRSASEVVVDSSLAATSGGPGGRVTLQVDGAARRYTVSGVAGARQRGGSPAVFFTEAHLIQLAGHPGTVDAIGVVAGRGVSDGALRAALGDAVAGHGGKGHGGEDHGGGERGARVLTGAERGEAEQLDAPGARGDLLAMLASVAATVVMIALLVIATTLSQAVHQRSGELALLRAVGATPRQLRSAVGREASRVAGAAALLGAAGSVPLGLLMRSLLATDPLPLPVPVWLPLAAGAVGAVIVTLAARPVALLAARSITRLRPASALGAARAPEPDEPGRARTVAGVLLAVAGLGSAGAATAQGGQAAALAASAAATSLIIAVALLGPWVARISMRVLGAPARRAGGAAGFLAARSAAAHSRRLGAALTPIVLVVAFVCVQLAAGSTLERAAGRQASDALRADLVVTGPAAGIPSDAADAARGTPGVAAATGLLRSAVVLAHRETGDPKLDRYPVLGVTADQLSGTLDARVTSGDPADLTGRDTVAVGRDRAGELGAGVGDLVRLRLGDGTRVRLRVVAVYERSLGLGEFMLPREALAAHVSAPRDRQILVRSKGRDAASALRRALAPYEGLRVRAATADDVRISPSSSAQDDALVVIGVGVIGGFALLAVVSTLALITVGRRPEFRLLRLVGAGRGQLLRMRVLETGLISVAGLAIGTLVAAVPLTAFALSATGSLPSLPPERYGVLALTVTVAAAAGTLLPGAGGAGRRGGRG
ncbi:putative ABC transport system permease protein [Streptomyces sp. 840.1]|uniref:ABC transporter permease n=1 Tax=Streptomyces sp. 840.1 TaxID=2485152 RepID=UPI000FB5BC56|nr:putative ABC transport system permease protein [Streptomyces sp. 840.1]